MADNLVGPATRWRARSDSTAWRSDAACRGAPPGFMYPDDMEGVAAAKAVCAGCVVREECLEYALANDEQFGIWGGESATALRNLRRARKAASRPAATRPPARRDSRGPAKGRPPSRGTDDPPSCGG